MFSRRSTIWQACATPDRVQTDLSRENFQGQTKSMYFIHMYCEYCNVQNWEGLKDFNIWIKIFFNITRMQYFQQQHLIIKQSFLMMSML